MTGTQNHLYTGVNTPYAWILTLTTQYSIQVTIIMTGFHSHMQRITRAQLLVKVRVVVNHNHSRKIEIDKTTYDSRTRNAVCYPRESGTQCLPGRDHEESSHGQDLPPTNVSRCPGEGPGRTGRLPPDFPTGSLRRVVSVLPSSLLTCLDQGHPKDQMHIHPLRKLLVLPRDPTPFSHGTGPIPRGGTLSEGHGSSDP